MSTSIPSHRDTARHAKLASEPVNVEFTLDDGYTPVHWHTPVASTTDSHFTTPGGFIIRYDAISHLATLSGSVTTDTPNQGQGGAAARINPYPTETPAAKTPRKKAAK